MRQEACLFEALSALQEEKERSAALGCEKERQEAFFRLLQNSEADGNTAQIVEIQRYYLRPAGRKRNKDSTSSSRYAKDEVSEKKKPNSLIFDPTKHREEN